MIILPWTKMVGEEIKGNGGWHYSVWFCTCMNGDSAPVNENEEKEQTVGRQWV